MSTVPARLEYPLFEDSDIDDVRQPDAFAASGTTRGSATVGMRLGTSHADYLRDLYARDTVRDLGRLNPRGRPVHVYINGLYWGLYILSERPDDGFAAEHLGGDEEDYDILYATSPRWNWSPGDLTAWNALLTSGGGRSEQRRRPTRRSRSSWTSPP